MIETPTIRYTSATFSPCGQFRYTLIRGWDSTKPLLPWGLCNPSVAGSKDDGGNERSDPTDRKVFGFTWRMDEGRYGGYVIWNPYAFISTDPKGLRAAGWPVGPNNDRHILEACAMGDGKVMVGWGVNLRGLERPRKVLDLLRSGGFRPHALATTKDGLPTHPLMLGYEKAHVRPYPNSTSGEGR